MHWIKLSHRTWPNWKIMNGNTVKCVKCISSYIWDPSPWCLIQSCRPALWWPQTSFLSCNTIYLSYSGMYWRLLSKKDVSFSVLCRSPNMTAKISENEIKPDDCALPKGQRASFQSRRNTLIRHISSLPRLSKSVLVFVRSGKKERCTWCWVGRTGLSKRKLVQFSTN